MDKPHISIDELRKRIEDNLPNILFILGKSCTGKSTFSKSLEPLGYKYLELDKIVLKNVRDKFKLKDNGESFFVYNGKAPLLWQNSFELAARKYILKNIKNSKVVIDSAIFGPKVLNRIFCNKLKNLMFVYFHPFDQNFYQQCITKRFENEFKSKIRTFTLMDRMTPEIFDDYTKNGINSVSLLKIISEYRNNHTEKSVDSYSEIKKIYPNIILTGY